MSNDFYDKEGKYIGSSVSSADSTIADVRAKTRDAAQISGIGMIAFICVVVFGPLAAPSVWLFMFLDNLGIHTLFVILLSAIPLICIVYILYKFKIARTLYSALITIGITAAVFGMMTTSDVDYVWSTFVALILLFIGGWITRTIYKW